MPKLSYNPVDRTAPIPGSMMALRIGGMAVMAISLLAVAFLLASFGRQGEKPEWGWNTKRVIHNFVPIMTDKEVADMLKSAASGALSQVGVEQPGEGEAPPPPPTPRVPDPFAPEPTPEIPRDPGSVIQSEQWAARDAEDVQRARMLTRGKVFNVADEVRQILDFTGFDDHDQTRCMGEHAAHGGRQARPNERLTVQVLHGLAPSALHDHVEVEGYFYGPGKPAIEEYRGRVFRVSGRLFDLYEVKYDQPVLLDDGKAVNSTYEAVIATVDRGVARDEFPIEHRVVIVRLPALPDWLRPYLNSGGTVSQADKLATEAVNVRLDGAYLRRWVYSRAVAPFSTPARPVYSQAFAPMLLATTLEADTGRSITVTDEMLQQVRDSQRGDPIFVESEAAYYALMARAADPSFELAATPKVGYFDLAGASGETGPRYRGQGIRVAGMIGEDYVAVVFPPNVSGLRRVYRTLVVADTGNLSSPSRYLVDMIEAPEHLEPLAQVGFTGAYYRNVFEVKDSRSTVRPLLIVRRVGALNEGANRNDIYYVIGGVSAFLALFAVLVWFILSDRRERRAFEATTMEVARKRLEKRGGLKLKPLPGQDDSAKPPGA